MLMRKSHETAVQPHWISKSLAGLCLGFLLALALSSLFAWLGPGGIEAANKVQFNMWLMAPLWMVFFVTVYWFRTGLRAWLWMGSATILAFLMLALVRWLNNGGS